MSTQTSGITRWYNRAGQAMANYPGLDYLMIRITVFVLTGIGVVMVMSSSMTWSIQEGSSVWGTSFRQAIMVVAGLVMFWVCLRVTPDRYRKWAWWLVGIAALLLILVLIPGIGTGREEVGSQSWIVLGPLRLQPSEFAKVTIAIFGAHYLADRRPTHSGLDSPYTAFTVIAGLLVFLIFLESDMGMAVAFSLVAVLILFFAGVARAWIVAAGVVGAVGMVGIMLAGSFRSHRFHVYFDALFGQFHDTKGNAYQTYQGFLSLADGSVGGVGLGQSRAKWFYLPEARNDFIFAIIGEELGLWGGAIVVILFAVLGFFGFRTALRAQDRFQSLLAATLTAGMLSQAFINIGYVVGLLPVTGIQLPMISAGGTSAVITLTSMGILANIARHEPEAISATQNYGRPLFDRMFLISEPRPPRDAHGRRPRAGQPLTGSETSSARFGTPLTALSSTKADSPSEFTNRRAHYRGRRTEDYDKQGYSTQPARSRYLHTSPRSGDSRGVSGASRRHRPR